MYNPAYGLVMGLGQLIKNRGSDATKDLVSNKTHVRNKSQDQINSIYPLIELPNSLSPETKPEILEMPVATESLIDQVTPFAFTVPSPGIPEILDNQLNEMFGTPVAFLEESMYTQDATEAFRRFDGAWDLSL